MTALPPPHSHRRASRPHHCDQAVPCGCSRYRCCFGMLPTPTTQQTTSESQRWHHAALVSMGCPSCRCYKQLKKHLKRLPERGTLEGMNPIAEADAQALSETEAAFVRTLNADVQVSNSVDFTDTGSVAMDVITAISRHEQWTNAGPLSQSVRCMLILRTT